MSLSVVPLKPRWRFSHDLSALWVAERDIHVAYR